MDLVLFDPWRKKLGISATTAWRWRQAGLIRTVKVRRRLFVPQNEISRFEQRAAVGEFAVMGSKNSEALHKNSPVQRSHD